MNVLKQVVENVWEANAPLKLPGLRMDHRLTVLRLHNGELVVHSPIEFSAPLHKALLEVGRPKWFIAPSRFHDMFWPNWFRAFPNARFVAAPGVREDHPDLPFTDVLAGGANYWEDELVLLPIGGMPKINEVALLHPASRSLLIADLIFNLDAAAQNLLGRLFLKANGIFQTAGISRIFRSYIKDRAAFVDSIDEIQSHSFERIILGHGGNLAGNEALQGALSAAGFADGKSLPANAGTVARSI
ncbi:MAG TPA: DUF4336 domain-containing protein [Verrucomicrobiae bacterium]